MSGPCGNAMETKKYSIICEVEQFELGVRFRWDFVGVKRLYRQEMEVMMEVLAEVMMEVRGVVGEGAACASEGSISVCVVGEKRGQCGAGELGWFGGESACRDRAATKAACEGW